MHLNSYFSCYKKLNLCRPPFPFPKADVLKVERLNHKHKHTTLNLRGIDAPIVLTQNKQRLASTTNTYNYSGTAIAHDYLGTGNCVRARRATMCIGQTVQDVAICTTNIESRQKPMWTPQSLYEDTTVKKPSRRMVLYRKRAMTLISTCHENFVVKPIFTYIEHKSQKEFHIEPEIKKATYTRLKIVYPLGTPLSQLTPSDTTSSLNSILHILEAVQHCHDNNIAHRDIKPDNILVINNRAKLSDFDQAKKLKPKDVTYGYKGTITYIAPEQIHPQARYIPKSSDDLKKADAYSTGRTLFEFLNAHRRYDNIPVPRPGYSHFPEDKRLPLDAEKIKLKTCLTEFKKRQRDDILQFTTSHHDRRYSYAPQIYLMQRTHSIQRQLIAGLCDPDPETRMSIPAAIALIKTTLQ